MTGRRSAFGPSIVPSRPVADHSDDDPGRELVHHDPPGCILARVHELIVTCPARRRGDLAVGKSGGESFVEGCNSTREKSSETLARRDSAASPWRYRGAGFDRGGLVPPHEQRRREVSLASHALVAVVPSVSDGRNKVSDG